MPWKELKIMDQREQFVLDYLTGDYPKGAAVYGISRPTGDKWLVRYHAQSGPAAPHAAAPDAGRAGGGDCGDEAPASEFWAEEDSGPRAVASEEAWPVDSTVGAILKHAGLVRPRRRRLPGRSAGAPGLHGGGPELECGL